MGRALCNHVLDNYQNNSILCRLLMFPFLPIAIAIAIAISLILKDGSLLYGGLFIRF